MEKYTIGFNQEKIQNMNRTLLLNMLRKEGICSRVHLAKLTQLKQATITNLVNDFIHWGIVKEVGFLTGIKGRRSIGISINNDDYGVLAIRLARKNYSVGIFNLSGESVQLKRVEIEPDQLPEITMTNILSDAQQLIAQTENRKIIAIGAAIPGPYSTKKERIEIMTGITGWNLIPIKQLLEDTFHLPVFMEQDANAGALAQYWYNNEELSNEMLVYLAVGQGVGAGIISNGEILHGSIGIAGEVGHISVNFNGPICSCGNRGCLENYCSSIAFTAMVNEALKTDPPLSFADASALLVSENPVVTDVFLKLCDILSVGIVSMINCFNPSILVIGDELSHIAPKLMLNRITQNIQKQLLPGIYENTKVCMSLVQPDSIVHGAAAVAIKHLFSYPEKYFTQEVQ